MRKSNSNGIYIPADNLSHCFGENEVPQPQEDAALGFSTLNDDSISLSSKSTVDPFKYIIETLSKQYNRERYLPDIQVTEFDKDGDRSLILTHNKRNNLRLDEIEADDVVYNIAQLWNYPVYLISEDEEGRVDEISHYGMM